MRGGTLVVLLLGALVGCGARADWPDLRDRNAEDQARVEPRLGSIRKEHPRIFCTEPDIAAARQRIEQCPQVAEVWEWVSTWAKGSHYYQSLWATPTQMQACCIAYRIADGDPQMLEHAVAIADFLAEAEGDGWTWPRICKGLAMAYDWLYEDLTPEQRERYGRAALNAAKQCYGTWRHSEFNNHLYLEYGPILYAGIALYEEGIDDEAARRLALDGLDLLVKRMMPAHDMETRGEGGWHESLSYHAFFTYEFAHLVELWSSASGEDIWTDFSGLDGDAHFCIYSARPWDDARVAMADIGGHDSYEENIAAYMVLLQRRRGDGLAGWWGEQIRQEAKRRHAEGQQYQLGDGKWWPYLLWYDPDVVDVPREDLPLQRHFSGIGWVGMRSSWEPDATFALFVCAPLYLGGHQHSDNNSFVIHKNALLALDSGVYDATVDHRGHYYARTIAHNCVTVTDPAEEFDGGTWGGNRPGEGPNDGGQLYGGAPEFVREVQPGDRFHRAEIVLYGGTDQYALTVGDATKSYRPQKLREFTRAFLYIRPDTFIVFDRVESTDAAFKKRWLLHSATEPVVDEHRAEVVNGDGRLTVETLLPAAPEIVTVGGEGREFEVEGVNYAPKKQYDADQAGRWRIEVSPTEARERDYFLHVLRTSDAADQGWPEATVEETNDSVTVSVGEAEVTFTKTGKLTASIRTGGMNP